MRWLRFAVLVIVTTIFQTSLVDIIAVTSSNIKPDLLLVLLVFFAVHLSNIDAVITSFIIGFAADIISPTMGPQIISFGLFGTLLADLHGVIAIKKWSYQTLAIFVIGLLTAALVHFLVFLKSESMPSDTYTKLFWTPLYSAIIGPFFFLPVESWMRTKKRRIRRF
ncbi:MAG: rod shape-determining protein MreD [Planctomycetes bacterium RBG_13_44_8b]|nr:MAG: rod shape-determining protein MreD [Planctomycetes bacterium RBG_13_44_8b]